MEELEKEIELILEDNTKIEKKNILLSQTIEQQKEENKELKEDLIDCLEELTEGNTITPRVAEYFDYMRERYLGKWGGTE